MAVSAKQEVRSSTGRTVTQLSASGAVRRLDQRHLSVYRPLDFVSLGFVTGPIAAQGGSTTHDLPLGI